MTIGIAVTALISAVCVYLGGLVPVVGSAVFAITIGMLLKNLTAISRALPMEAGLNFTSKKLLQGSIVLMGFGFSVQNIADAGLSSLSVTLVTIAAAFIGMFIFSKLLKTSYRLSNLIGVGTAICGGSAIAAVSPIIKADDQELAYAVSTIFLFNVMAVFIFPAVGHLLGMEQLEFGLWAGTAINDTSSVVAAAYAYGDIAGEHATVVKLTRATLIIPIALVYALVEALRSRQQGGSVRLAKIFPWFILFFVLAAGVNSLVALPIELTAALKSVSKFMITMALCAIGLKTDFRKILSAGIKPLLLGFLLWATVATTALLI